MDLITQTVNELRTKINFEYVFPRVFQILAVFMPKNEVQTDFKSKKNFPVLF